MTKLRPPGTVLDGLWQAIAILGRDGSSAATGKSYQFLRQCADEDDDTHHLSMRWALALDRACLRHGSAPILAGYKAELRRATPVEGDPMAALVCVMAEVGEVAAVLHAALAPAGAGGRMITRDELRDLLRETGQTIAALERLEAIAQAVSGLIDPPEMGGSR